jgi:O-antigen/teichoic acid export membrane protein
MTDRGVTWQETHPTRTVALNVGGRYLSLTVELVLGLVMLPLNMRYLGAPEYGLWMLAASIVSYFPVLDLGYGSALERFVAHYRAERNVRAINETASTAILLFAAMGLAAFGLMAAIALNIGDWFNLDTLRARTGTIVMFLVAAQFAIGFPFGGFGAVVNAFQRQYVNATIGVAVAIAVAVTNVLVLLAGGGLVELVAAATATRLAGFFAYRLNAYRVFPPLQVRLSLFRVARVREMTRFSVYMLIQDVASRANYAADPLVIAAMLSTSSVTVWIVGQRLADVVLQLTNQLNQVLFPVVVDCDSTRRDDRLRDLLVQGTRLSLATTLPVAGALALLAHPVVVGWTGPNFAAAADVVRLLALVVIMRVGTWTASTVLQGAGRHQVVAFSNAIAAAVNIGLSILLVRDYGLPGVALATLIPVTVRALAVIIPVSCRRVDISLPRFVASAVWPAAWPALVTLGGLAILRDESTASLLSAVLQGAAAGAVYAALFLGIAVGRQDRARYLGKLRTIARRPALEAA